MTEYQHLTRSLEESLRDAREVQDARRRTMLCVAYGTLTRGLHLAGFVSTTLQPRNVLVRPAPERDCWLCDQPAAAVWGRSVYFSRAADVDLYDIAFSAGRQQQMSRVDRYRVILAYVDRDRAAARWIWRRLSVRSRWLHRAWKGVVRGIHGRLLGT